MKKQNGYFLKQNTSLTHTHQDDLLFDMWLQFILPLTGNVVSPVQNLKKKMYSLKRLYKLNFKCHVLRIRRQDPFYDKGKEMQYEFHIFMVADQACLHGFTL